LIAQVLHSMLAIPTGSIHTAHPGHAHPHSQRELSRGPVGYFPHDLMAWNKIRFGERQVALKYVQIGTADSAGDYPYQYVSRFKLRTRHILHLQK
jgi:hypothetical protein